MKIEKILDAIYEFRIRGEEVEVISISPSDLVDLLKEGDLMYAAKPQEGSIGTIFGVKIEVDSKIPPNHILINHQFLKSEWNPSSRWG